MRQFLKPLNLLVVIICCISNKTFAQVDRATWQIGANVGYNVYQGDLTPGALSGYKYISYFFGINGTKIIDERFSVKLNISHGKVKADESRFSSFHPDRAFSFSTKVTEITPVFTWNIFNDNFHEFDQSFYPHIFGGVGMAFFSVDRDYSKMNKTVFNVNHWVNKGLVADSAVVLPKSAFLIPIGAGTEYYINDDFSLTADFTYRFCFTDYLDGFSKSGNSKKHDTYHTFTIGVVHTLFSGSAGGVSSPRSIF